MSAVHDMAAKVKLTIESSGRFFSKTDIAGSKWAVNDATAPLQTAAPHTNTDTFSTVPFLKQLLSPVDP
jgi:hypothetical protein